ncbi:hypothetical protein DFS33DRAFT_1433344 [Desarmillaria ectypa]|nr:hypothetical protein DFS33DRAFT_1433344 [Desarmillaria ectypa]
MLCDKLLIFSSLFLAALALLSPEITSGGQSVLFVNEHSRSSIRSYTPDRDIYVPFVPVEDGEHKQVKFFGFDYSFQLKILQWTLSKTQGGYTIENVATGGFIKAEDKHLVTTGSDGDATMFAISPAGGDSYVIKLPYEDLVWTVQDPVYYQGSVTLAPSVGSDAQLWYIDEAGEPCDVN